MWPRHLVVWCLSCRQSMATVAQERPQYLTEGSQAVARALELLKDGNKDGAVELLIHGCRRVRSEHSRTHVAWPWPRAAILLPLTIAILHSNARAMPASLHRDMLQSTACLDAYSLSRMLRFDIGECNQPNEDICI